MRFASGCIANLTASRISRDKVRKFRCFQPDMYVSVDAGERALEVWRLRRREGERPAIEGGPVPVAARRAAWPGVGGFRGRGASRSRAPRVTGGPGRSALALATRVAEAMESQVTMTATMHRLDELAARLEAGGGECSRRDAELIAAADRSGAHRRARRRRPAARDGRRGDVRPRGPRRTRRWQASSGARRARCALVGAPASIDDALERVRARGRGRRRRGRDRASHWPTWSRWSGTITCCSPSSPTRFARPGLEAVAETPDRSARARRRTRSRSCAPCITAVLATWRLTVDAAPLAARLDLIERAADDPARDGRHPRVRAVAAARPGRRAIDRLRRRADGGGGASAVRDHRADPGGLAALRAEAGAGRADLRRERHRWRGRGRHAGRWAPGGRRPRTSRGRFGRPRRTPVERDGRYHVRADERDGSSRRGRLFERASARAWARRRGRRGAALRRALACARGCSTTARSTSAWCRRSPTPIVPATGSCPASASDRRARWRRWRCSRAARSPSVRSIALDTSSRTSAALVRILCRRVFDVAPTFAPHAPDLGAMLAHGRRRAGDRRPGAVRRPSRASVPRRSTWASSGRR